MNCEFIISPRILFNDKNLSRTQNDLLSLIISLTLKYGYCYATNKYLANYITTSPRTITDSLSKLIKLKYIKVKYVNNNRKIYLNKEKIPLKNAIGVAKNRSIGVADTCEHNIYNKNKIEYNKIQNFKRKGIVPHWLEHSEDCQEQPLSDTQRKELEEMLKEFE